MNKLKLTILVVIFVMIVFTGLVFQAGFSAGRTVLNSSYQRDLLSETDLSPFLHAVMQEHLFREVSAELPGNLALLITGTLSRVFDQEWLSEQYLLVSDQYIAYIKGKKDSPEAFIDLQQKKKQLQKGIENALDLIPGQIIAMMGFEPQDLKELAAGLVTEISLPDKIDVSKLLEEQGVSEQFSKMLGKLRQYHVHYTYLPYALFMIFFLIIYKLAGLAGALKWAGGAILVSGVMFSLFLQCIRSYYLKKMVTELAFRGLPEPDMLLSSIRYVIDTMAAISIYFALFGLLVMLIGGIMAWVGLFRKKPSLN